MKKPKWKITFRWAPFSLKPYFRKTPLRWKNKFDSPRCEVPPNFEFSWLGFRILGNRGSDEQWEKYLWVHYFNGGDIRRAKRTWPWIDPHTKKSTWDEEN